ncbi:MAG TPA: hypothetical protein VFN61_06340 [Acidimicrobiales bacterium]|nr:hypothetical protein [Acidimicrobiales bacterium]
MKRINWWAAAVVPLVLASLFFAFTTALAVIACFGHPPRNDRGATIAAAVILALLTALLVWLARITEHHAKARNGLRAAVTASVPRALRYRAPRRPVAATRLHVSAGFFLLIWFGTLLGFIVGTISGYGNWARSSETQSHGTHELATVTSVDPIWHSSRSGSWYTYNYEVRLAHAVGRVTYSTVYTPEQTQFASTGQRIAVLVDPEQPSYAELPGVSMAGLVAPITFTVLSLAMIAGTIWAVLRIVATHRLRRQSISATFSGSAYAPKSGQPFGHRR